MGCCGCSLYASTITAGIFTLLDCLIYLPYDIVLLLMLTYEDLAKIDPGSKPTNFQWYSAILYKLDTLVQPKMRTIIIALVSIKLAIRVIWFISSIALFIGNSKEYKKCLTFWQIMTAARIVFGIATMIYACVKIGEDIKKLFNDISDWDPDKDPQLELQIKTYVAEFLIFINFLELSPIWWIIFIAFMIFVFKRGQEIDSRKVSQVNQWGNFPINSQTNGNAGQPRAVVGGSALAHPVSLTQEPNPFTIHREENNNRDRDMSREMTREAYKRETMPTAAATAPSAPVINVEPASVQPILQVNEVIAIPRVTLAPKPNTVNFQTRFDTNTDYDNRKRNPSSSAQRTSYIEYDRHPDRAPKRNNSFNTSAQPYPQRSRDYYSYDNRGYQRTEQDFQQNPGLVKRSSVRRN